MTSPDKSMHGAFLTNNRRIIVDSELHILQHSLGVGDYGDKPSYRNHFVTGKGSSDHLICQALVEKGLMKIQPMDKMLTGGDDCFVVTQKGIDYVALNSPMRPPEPKMTRSQKNYRAYLDADCGFSFSEWMRFSKARAT